MRDTCLSAIFAPFLLQVHNTCQGRPGILLSSAPKAAVVEVGGTCTSPACHPHSQGPGQRAPVAPPDTRQRKTGRQTFPREGTRCHAGSITIPISYRRSGPTPAALLAATWALPLTTSVEWGQVLKFWNNRQLTLSLPILVITYFDKQGQIWPKGS